MISVSARSLILGKKLGLLLGLVLCLLLCQTRGIAQPAGAKSPVKLFGKVDVLATYCAGSGITLESIQLPARIMKVRPGSPAFHAGVAEGDQVLSGSIEGNRLELKISREGREYLVKLRARADRLPRKDLGVSRSNLTNWKVVVLADRSGSMTRDLGTSGISRWRWVSDQIESLARELEKASGEHLDLGLFNQSYKYYRNLSADQLTDTISSTVATGESELAPLLKDALDSYFKGEDRRPLLLAIITDGKTAGKDTVRAIVRDAAAKADRSRLRLVFFQTGYSEEGARFMDTLNDREKSVVRTVLFETLGDSGLLGGLRKALD